MRYLLILVGLWGCAPAEEETDDCQVVSDRTDFVPVCSQARLTLYDEQTVLTLPGGSNATLTGYIEANPVIQMYGGQSGNTLNMLLEIDLESWTAVNRSTTLTIAALDDETAELQLDAHFSDGLNVDGIEIVGPLFAPVSDRRISDTGTGSDSGI